MLWPPGQYLTHGPSLRVRPRSSSCSTRFGKRSCSRYLAKITCFDSIFPFQGNMAESCQISSVQGTDDLYGLLSNCLKVGYEYTAKYNLGYSIPYNTSFQRCDANLLGGPFQTISATDRGVFRLIYELAYAHYVSTMNLSMLYTSKIVSAPLPTDPIYVWLRTIFDRSRRSSPRWGAVQQVQLITPVGELSNTGWFELDDSLWRLPAAGAFHFCCLVKCKWSHIKCLF